MNYKEEMEFCKKFFDTIDFIKFMNKNDGIIEVSDLMNDLEKYYEKLHSDLLPKEFGGFFFNFMTADDFCSYLSKRYGYKIRSEIIERYYLIK